MSLARARLPARRRRFAVRRARSSEPPGSAGFGVMRTPAGPVLQLRSLLQRKIALNKPGDRYDREADAAADRVLSGRQVSAITGRESTMNQRLFRQGGEVEIPEEPSEAGPEAFDRRLDWFEMRRPFTTRGAESLLYLDMSMYDAIGNAWDNNYNFFHGFGLGDRLSADAANFFTPFSIDAALKRDFPTAGEIFEREADVSSIIVSPTLLNFDLHDIPGTLRFPFMKIFGVNQPNPYAPVPR